MEAKQLRWTTCKPQRRRPGGAQLRMNHHRAQEAKVTAVMTRGDVDLNTANASEEEQNETRARGSEKEPANNKAGAAP